ncbi:MAG TPA: ABC transporter substrate-binding protein, partial [Actinomycetes bacterium]|nr:ABC transporter substrate-binding protein [Actinomycetes bacterium]
MIDAPGPWGTGPFILTEGFSSLEAEVALVQADPFACVWLPTGQPRTPRLVLEANPDHWNIDRGPRVERVVFRNDLSPTEALDLVCTTEGEVDVVTEVAPTAARRVSDSEHAKLVRVDAMRVLVGVINRDAEGAPLHDLRVRRALNLAVDRDRLIQEAFAGRAYPLAGLTPHYAAGVPKGQRPYPHDPHEARELLTEARWPAGRALRLAAPADLEGVARLLADDFTASLGIEVDLTVIPPERLLAAQHALVEKVLPLPFDVLVHAWFDLSADAPPAVLHREFFHSTGAFRAGPPIPELEQLLAGFAVTTDPVALERLATDIDRFAYDQALSVFLCAPQALYAVNRHVAFDGHAATFELAETEVAP